MRVPVWTSFEMDASEERATIKGASRKDFGLYGNVVSSFHPSTLRSRQTGTKFTFWNKSPFRSDQGYGIMGYRPQTLVSFVISVG